MRKPPAQSKLATQVLALFLGVFILQLLLLLWSFLSSYRSQESASVQSNALLLQQANDNYLSGIVDQIDRRIIRAYYNRLFWTDDAARSNDRIAEYYSLLSDAYMMNDQVQSVYLYASAEDRLYIMDRASYAKLPLYSNADNNFYISDFQEQAQAWITDARESKGNLSVVPIDGIRRDVNGNTVRLLSFSRALFDPLNQRKPSYVMSINLEMSFFDRLAGELCTSGEKLAVLGNDGGLIYHNMSDTTEVETLRRTMSTDIRQQDVVIGGEAYLMLKSKASLTGWQMMKAIPKKELLEEAQRVLLGNLSGTAFLFLLSALLLAFIITRVVRPVNELAVIMEHYEIKQNARTAYMNRRDEIGRLYRSFATMHDHIDRLITQEYAAQIREKQARIEALQAQVNPHFLNNTLQTIAGIAVDRDVPEIEHIVSALSAILRYSLTKSRKLVTLREEVRIVTQYMSIQKYRFGERINLEITLGEGTLDCLIPVLTLQLAVENAVRHGMETKLGRGLIRVYERDEGDGVLELVIEDNGAGVTPAQLLELRQSLSRHAMDKEGWSGNGLINMNERIRGFWGDAYGLSLENRDSGGLIVRMRLPRTYDESEDDDE